MTQSKACVSIQEEIAWGRTLSPEHQGHVLECPACRQISLEFHRLDSAFSFADVSIPDDFADRVMLRLEKHDRASARNDRFGFVLERVVEFFQLRVVQAALVALVFAFPFSGAH